MKLSTPSIGLCLLSLVLASCQSVTVSDIQSSLEALDSNLKASSYVVRPGETLETIAFRYQTTVSALLELNPDAASGVSAGMYLNVRPSSVATRPAGARNAGWTPPEDSAQESAAYTAPAVSYQAVPIAAPASDQYLLGREASRVQTVEYPAVARADTEAQGFAAKRHTGQEYREQGYAEQAYTQRGHVEQGFVESRGYPVEEVIEDDNFKLPGTDVIVDEELQPYVGGWQWPLNGQLAREYDVQRPNGRGIEIVGLPGQEVYATRDGVVDWVARSPDGVGKVVIVRHDDDYLSIYSNAQDLFVSMKDSVRQGDPIASLGANANDEPLLRFEISKDGNLLNPIDFLTPR